MRYNLIFKNEQDLPALKELITECGGSIFVELAPFKVIGVELTDEQKSVIEISDMVTSLTKEILFTCEENYGAKPPATVV